MTASSAATPVVSKPQVGRPARTAVVMPPQPEGAFKAWRRGVTGIDPTQRGAWALVGVHLKPGCAYDIPAGAVVVTCDVYRGHRVVRMLRVETAELAEAKVWDLKSPLGKRVVQYIARRIPAGIRGSDIRALEDDSPPNKWDGWCYRCSQEVSAGKGRAVRVDGRIRVSHDGECPPLPPLQNRYAGYCHVCGGWIEAGEGIVVTVTPIPLVPPAWDAVPDEKPRYRPQHHRSCPEKPAPRPPQSNTYWAWCKECGEAVPPGEGIVDGGVRHTSYCPPPRWEYPTWRIRRPEGRRRFIVGETLRQRIMPWGGEQPVPGDAPGCRVIDERMAEVIVTVLESHRGWKGRHLARVRIATWAEAEDILAVEIALLPDVRPLSAGFKAMWTVERFGDRPPWLAEIVGRDRTYGFDRRFLRSKEDWKQANSKGTRGVRYSWTLGPNRVYEARYQQSRSRSNRVYLRTTAQGDIEEISRDLVEAWLDQAAEWIAAAGEADGDGGLR